MKISLIIRTDGRREYLPLAVASAEDHLKADFDQLYIIDDSGDPDYVQWLETSFPNFTVVAHSVRLGMNECARTMVRTAVASSSEFVFSTEDDFCFPSTVNVKKMARLLHCEDHLGQLVLKRQPVNDVESAHGGFMQAFPERYTERSCPIGNWVESTQTMFSGNPSLVRVAAIKDATDIEMPSSDTYEVPVGLSMFENGYSLAFYGKIDDKPRCEHLGSTRSVGYRW